ncbi:winged helix-turn-helix domain-containing protein [Streptomyces sp. NPDC088124]|uniref:ArsR/SmtB family transcription factor n=1 Tax=Streptomyces sp. NPDC088124 TaxID=3154654 RepID=UPI003427787A
MVYRIHFTAEDLTRTRIAQAAMPMIELHAAARALQQRSQPALLDTWRRHTLSRLSPQARLALSMVPPFGESPDFLSPMQSSTPDEELERVRATPRRQIIENLASVAETRTLPAWARHLADDTDLRNDFFDGWAHLYTQLLQPYWRQITDLHASDRTLRLQQFMTGGVEHLLAQANPRWMQWSPPVLKIRTVLRTTVYDLHLEGRGIVLTPSSFLTSSAAVLDDGHARPVVTYPAGKHEALSSLTVLSPRPAAPRGTTAVTALLGKTRAAVLSTIAEHPGCTTTELAALSRIAPASASEHATVLREAGLIHTTRHRNRVLHSPSSLGRALLNKPASRPTA